MKKTYLIIFAFTLVTGLYSQPTFHRYFSLPGKTGILYRTIQTGDAGFVSVGKVSDFTTFDDDLLIMKTDAAGNAAWIKKCMTTDSEEFTDIIEVSGGDLVAVGRAFNMSTFISAAVIEKFSSGGVRQWSRSYSIDGHSAGAKKISADAEGNLYVLGTVAVDGASDDYFILKLDPNGNILTQNTFGTPDSDYPLAFLRKGNGDFFICGWDNTFTGENIHLIRINADMTVSWSKLISGTEKYFAYDMKERSDGDLVLAGRFDDGATSYDILVCTLDDSSGGQVWANSYSAAEGYGTYAYGLAIAPGDIIAVTGVAESTDQGTFLLSTDGAGIPDWSYKFGSPGSTGEGYGIAPAAEGGFLVCGSLSNSSDAIAQLIRTNSSGTIPCNTTGYELVAGTLTLPMQTLAVTTGTTNLTAQDITLAETSFNNLTAICTGTGYPETAGSAVTVGPNPSRGSFTVTVPGSWAGSDVMVVNSSGIIMLRGSMPDGNEAGSISKTFRLAVPAGAYIVRVGNDDHQEIRKLMIGN